MKWPELGPDAVCHTPITIRLEAGGINEDGSPIAGWVIETKCNYSQKNKWKMDAERRLIQRQATVLSNGDSAPELETLAGTVTIDGSGESWIIYAASRAMNPDGTVNYTSLELI